MPNPAELPFASDCPQETLSSPPVLVPPPRLVPQLGVSGLSPSLPVDLTAQAGRRTFLGALSLGLATSVSALSTSTAQATQAPSQPAPIPGLYFDGRYAHASGYHPYFLHRLVQHANALVHLPYKYGGGHVKLVDDGYDCSGALSYILCHAGFLRRPLMSSEFARFGQPGCGLYVTIFVRPGVHVFMNVCGLRYDTGNRQGPRWHPEARSYRGFQARRIPGL